MTAVKVNAFQMDGTALLTVKCGDEVIVSGAFDVDCPSINTNTRRVHFCDGDVLEVSLTATITDPAKVGTGPQRYVRMYWEGTAELED